MITTLILHAPLTVDQNIKYTFTTEAADPYIIVDSHGVKFGDRADPPYVWRQSTSSPIGLALTELGEVVIFAESKDVYDYSSTQGQRLAAGRSHTYYVRTYNDGGDMTLECPDCHGTNQMTDSYWVCPDCSVRVVGGDGTVAPGEETAPGDNDAGGDEAAGPVKTWTCPNCGTMGNNWANYHCAICGEQRPQGYAVVPMTDWQEILSSLRWQTHENRALHSGELADIISRFNLVGDQFEAITSGTFTSVVESTLSNEVVIEHGLGRRPNFYVLFADETAFTNSGANAALNFSMGALIPVPGMEVCGFLFSAAGAIGGVCTYDEGYIQVDGTSDKGSNYYFVSEYFTDTTVTFYSTSKCRMAPGRTFHWVCGYIKNTY